MTTWLSLLNYRMMVGVTADGLITGVRKEGGGSLALESINEMTQVCDMQYCLLTRTTV